MQHIFLHYTLPKKYYRKKDCEEEFGRQFKMPWKIHEWTKANDIINPFSTLKNVHGLCVWQCVHSVFL